MIASGRFAGLLLACAALAGCGPAAAIDALAPGGSGRVAAAPAGDLVVLTDGRRVRLAGVEAPKGDAPYADEATDALAGLAVGREVELLEGGATDGGYGRVLAHVRDKERRAWIEGALLRAGAVRVRTYPDNRAMAQEMLLEEARARAAGRGLWALPAYRVRLPGEVVAAPPGLTLVEGRVAEVSRRGGRVRLSFPGGFHAEVAPAAEHAFWAAGIDLAQLEGRLVRLRGSPRAEAEGMRLWLDHPEQLERLVEP